MSAPNAYTLKYQRRTTPQDFIFVRKAGDRYAIQGQEEKLTVYALRKDFRFIEDSAPKNNIKLSKQTKKPEMVLNQGL